MFFGKRLTAFNIFKVNIVNGEVVPSFHMSNSHIFIIGGLAGVDSKYV